MAEGIRLAYCHVLLVCTVCDHKTRIPYYAGMLQEFACDGCDAAWDMALDDMGRILAYDHEDWPAG